LRKIHIIKVKIK